MAFLTETHIPGSNIFERITAFRAAAVARAAQAREFRRVYNELSGMSDRDLADIGIFDIDAHPIPAAQGEPVHTHFNVGYLFTAAMVAPVAAAEIRAARWVPLGRIGELAPDAALRRVAGKMRAV